MHYGELDVIDAHGNIMKINSLHSINNLCGSSMQIPVLKADVEEKLSQWYYAK